MLSRQVHHHVIVKGHDIHGYVKSSVRLVHNTHVWEERKDNNWENGMRQSWMS